MKTYNSTLRRTAALAGTLLMALVACPTPALAEGADASILIPKPAEFIPALIAFLVIWFILAKYAWPKILKVLDDRQAKIQADMDAAEQSKLKAAEDQQSYEEKLAEAQREADEIIASAKRAAEQERAQIVSKAQSEASGIISRAHEAVESERRTAMSSLTDQVADLSVEMAEKIIGENLDEEKQRKLIEKYLAEAVNLDDSK